MGERYEFRNTGDPKVKQFPATTREGAPYPASKALKWYVEIKVQTASSTRTQKLGPYDRATAWYTTRAAAESEALIHRLDQDGFKPSNADELSQGWYHPHRGVRRPRSTSPLLNAPGPDGGSDSGTSSSGKGLSDARVANHGAPRPLTRP